MPTKKTSGGSQLAILINPQPVPRPNTDAAFHVRVELCRNEMQPMFDKLIRRHSVLVILAALIKECGEIAVTARSFGRADHKLVQIVVDRLLRDTECARRPDEDK